MRSRWGSCNIRTGRICVNRALAWESPELLEYIVVHELAHLVEPGHTRRFYAVVDAYFPGRNAAEARLRTLSRSL
jgi:predicted metal-dependent hydrolase